MQDFFFVGIISAIALGVLLFKSIMFVIHMVNVKKANEIIDANLGRIRQENHRAQQIQKQMSAIESVVDWKMDEPGRFVNDDLRQQFLMKTRTRRAPGSSDRVSPRDRVPLATTDFGEASDEDDQDQMDIVPIYTYNPNIGGTQKLDMVHLYRQLMAMKISPTMHHN